MRLDNARSQSYGRSFSFRHVLSSASTILYARLRSRASVIFPSVFVRSEFVSARDAYVFKNDDEVYAPYFILFEYLR